ncbi:uncharacterized protein JCM6883_007033 [Sporobolomyces salmoneus]|uniref:uncharacterized protein n=1 Tax=Sporobolomyces salmoneus TaxID=183962 RepID=UPI003181C068
MHDDGRGLLLAHSLLDVHREASSPACSLDALLDKALQSTYTSPRHSRSLASASPFSPSSEAPHPFQGVAMEPGQSFPSTSTSTSQGVSGSTQSRDGSAGAVDRARGPPRSSIDDTSLPHTVNNPNMTDPINEPSSSSTKDNLIPCGNGGQGNGMGLGDRAPGNTGSFEVPPLRLRRASPSYSSGHSTTGRPTPPAPLSIPSFPVLPPSIPSPSQTYQTPFQVSSILSLPAPLLYQLARTNSPAEQQKIAERSGTTEYLGAMSIPPPSPTTLVNDIQKLGLVMTTGGTKVDQPTESNNTSTNSSFAPALEFPSNGSSSESPLPSRRPSVQLSVPLDSVTSISSHPAIPRLLGHVFSPPTPGIVAPIGTGDSIQLAIRNAVASHPPSHLQVSSTIGGEGAGEDGKFEPVYASVEQWSYEVAKDQVFSSSRTIPSTSNATSPTSPSRPKRPGLVNSHSFNEREIANLATQVKNWALAEQAKQLEQQVVEHKSTAVVLAVQAAAKIDEEEGSIPSGGMGGEGMENHHEELDFGEYAETYKKQLDALASGYFAQLHRDALKRLVEKVEEEVQHGSDPSSSSSIAALDSSTSSRSGSHAPSLTTLTSLTHSRPQAEALHIQASAAAAVAANVMAAKEIARHAEQKLVGMGMDPQQIVQQAGVGVGLSTNGNEMIGGQEGSVGSVGMRSLEISPESIRAPSSSFATPPAGIPGPTQLQPPPLPPATTTQNQLRSPDLRDRMVVEDVGLVSAAEPGQPLQPGLSSSAPRLPPTTPPKSGTATTTQDPSPSSLPASHPPAPSTSSDSLSDPSLLASVALPSKRDLMLSYAHTLYAKDSTSKELLPLLHTIESIHPDHLPTLLLISCVYYTRGELESSLYYNKRLLAYDPNYVEAMSNIGTTLRAMGKWSEAETWWWKAIKLRPTYWDATENLLGVLCNPSSTSIVAPGEPPVPTVPRLEQALSLCEFVESQIYAVPASALNPAIPTSQTAFVNPLATFARPRNLPSIIPYNNTHRVQNLFYAKGNLRLALGDAKGAQDEYEKAIEVALSIPEWANRIPGLRYPIDGCTTRDLVVVTTVVGKILAAIAAAGSNSQLPIQTAAQLGVADERGVISFEGLFRVVKNGGDAYVQKLLSMGGGLLPVVLLEPQLLAQIPSMLFPELRSTLPSMLDPAWYTPPSPDGTPAESDPARRSVIASTNQTTSTMLLTLAKVLQDSLGPTSANQLSVGGVPASQSLLLPLYYMALSLYPSPSTCNNLGILLSTMNATTLICSQDPSKPPVVLTGQQLALRYYEQGLRFDPKHPHLYTNLGSLLKDMGQLPQAVAMYKRAVDFNPTFDVALANLANAVKDTGQIQESIPYYRRAVELNPNFPEAVCGLVNALGGVCDWQGRGGVDEEWIVDDEKRLVRAGPGQTRTGYMAQISNLVAKQLAEGLSYGQGSLRSYGGVPEWLDIISQAIYGVRAQMIPEPMKIWESRLTVLFSRGESGAGSCNEGGYLIRLVERLMRRIQRRWYLATYGPIKSSLESSEPLQRIAPTQNDLFTYRRPTLPPSLPLIPVPTVLPFHCFTLPVNARETRLISHRTGLRISHSTLNQPWMPPIVYPPPRPPLDGKINIGYVSSDLGNHPLSHLMQSVFGYHDLNRFNVFVYATSPSDKSPYRLKIENDSQHFYDVSAESTQQIVDRIVRDEIHVLINLSGYTKGARNEVFAARPAPVQMSYMGFASTLSAGWCDYFIVDPIVCPPTLVSGNQWKFWSKEPDFEPKPTDFEGDLDPESEADTFVYTEKLIYLPHSYFVTDHKQAWRESDEPRIAPKTTREAEMLWALEEDKRWKMRKEMFPDIRDDTIIFANWNQLYKIDPFIFRIWLSILKRFPNSILWLLRFPAPGEAHLKDTARQWAGEDIANRVVFTDVANKNEHIHRGRIADLFLDTTECNAHTTAADILWSGTPILTYPRHAHKMCSRVAASIAVATGLGPKMIVDSAESYEERAVNLAAGLRFQYVQPTPGALPETLEGRIQRRSHGELADLRKSLFLTRENSPLFDTKRWTVNLEKGLKTAWERWVSGLEFEDSPESARAAREPTFCIWVSDDIDSTNVHSRQPYF